MKLIDIIGGEAHQKFEISYNDLTIGVTLHFCSLVKMWLMNVTYNDEAINGVKLSVGVLHFLSRRWDFDFYIVDTSSNGLDPIFLNDFTSGRIKFYLLEAEEVEAVRGVSVEI